LVLVFAGAARAEAPRLYRVKLVRVEIAPPEGRPGWDAPEAKAAPGPKGKCCAGTHLADGTDPDVQVIVSAGARRLASRVHYDQSQADLGELGYFALSPAERFTVEVFDVDGEGREAIGKTSFAAPEEATAEPLAFGQVRRLELEVRPVGRAEESFVVSQGSLESPLYLFAGQSARVSAEGQLCAGRACTGPAGAAPGSALGRLAPAMTVGRLVAVLGEAEQPLAAEAHLRAARDDYLILSLTTSPAVRLSGSYRVTVAVEP
jgi:hypothetical protein